MDEPGGLGICILAGGEATRLPGKLALAAGEVPMLVRVYRNVAPAARDVYISVKGTLPPELDTHLDCPMVVDRWTLRGPLAGLVSTMLEMRAARVFAVAGDAPFIDAAFVRRLCAAWEAGDEAVVPVHDDGGRERIEPLAALYDREAFIREGLAVLQAGEGALRLVIDRLRARRLHVEDAAIFANVNTPAEYAAIRASL